MAMLDRLRSLISNRLASEGGFAIPTVMLMTVAAMGVASVGVMASIQGQSGVVRDQRTKSALEVAESGVNQALLYYNRGVTPCAAGEGEWCGPVTGMSVNGGSVAYWTRLGSGDECQVGNEVDCVEIVSQGTVNGVTRRVEVSASTVSTEASPGPGPFASAGVLSLENMTLDSNAIIHTGVATNGELTLNSNAKQCGQASVGIGKKMKMGSNARYYSNSQCTTSYSTYLQQALTLPAVNQGDAATNNDNGRFFSQDLLSGKKPEACWNGKTASGQTTSSCGKRELSVSSNSAITLGGSVYSFCKLTMRSNTALYVQAGSSVTIYFDSPEACGYSSGVTQLDLDSNARITSATGSAVSVALLFVGSETMETKIQLDSNTTVNGPCDQNFVIYAPRSNVDFDSNTHFCGAVAAKTVHLDSNAEIWSSKGSESFSLPGLELPATAPHYTPYRFVECSAVEASPPNAGC
jgi:type II secretory pathway pseudopilin PulG